MYINSKSYMHGTFCHSHCYINMLFQLNVCITACRYVVLFHTTLFFHTMLAPDFSCAVSGKFVQCWHSIAFAATSYQKINHKPVQNKNCQKAMLFRWHCTGFFSVQCCLESLVGSIAHNVFPVQCCPNSNMTLLNRISSCHVQFCLSGEPLGDYCMHKIFTCAQQLFRRVPRLTIFSGNP